MRPTVFVAGTEALGSGARTRRYDDVSTVRRIGERYSGLTVALVAVDLVATAVVGIVVLRLPPWWLLAVATFMIACRTTVRLYRRRLRLSYFDDLPRALAAVCAAFGVVIAVIMSVGENSVVAPELLQAVLVFLLVSEPLRALVFQVVRWVRRRFQRGERTVVVGNDAVGLDLTRAMLDYPEFGLIPIGILGPFDRTGAQALPVPLLDGDLAEVVVDQRVATVVLAPGVVGPLLSVEQTLAVMRLGATVLLVPHVQELYRDSADVERLRSHPLLRLATDPTVRPAWFAKRVLDRVFALAALAFLAPVILACVAAILIESGRPILFTQERIGMNERPFRIHKLRSLKPSDDREAATKWDVAGDPRIGPVGRFLRRTSLDELPQLWNVVRGEMSIVGPRPERPGFVRQFSADHERYWARHRVPPGLTGLAQVTGLRGNTSIADRSRYDNYYIANWSLWLDCKIVLLTTREVLRRGAH